MPNTSKYALKGLKHKKNPYTPFHISLFYKKIIISLPLINCNAVCRIALATPIVLIILPGNWGWVRFPSSWGHPGPTSPSENLSLTESTSTTGTWCPDLSPSDTGCQAREGRQAGMSSFVCSNCDSVCYDINKERVSPRINTHKVLTVT